VDNLGGGEMARHVIWENVYFVSCLCVPYLIVGEWRRSRPGNYNTPLPLSNLAITQPARSSQDLIATHATLAEPQQDQAAGSTSTPGIPGVVM
jgi:hypothetical protein